MINSRKYTLIDLFKATDNEESQYLPLNNIEVPIIQRDYAQGRNQPEVNRIRARFLDALYIALTTLKPITLDFVYGEINDKKNAHTIGWSATPYNAVPSALVHSKT